MFISGNKLFAQTIAFYLEAKQISGYDALIG